MTDNTHKTILDWIAYSVTGAAVIKILPAIAALFSIAWIGVQLYDRFFGQKKKD